MGEEQTAKRAIESVEAASFIADRAERKSAAPCQLEVCPGCGSRLVHPLEWAKAKNGHWHVTLRCPECEWVGGGVYEQRVLDRYDEALDEAAAELLEDLLALTHANFAEEAERFITALHADHVLAEDF